MPRIRHTPLDIGLAAGIILLGLPLVIGGTIGLGVYLYFFAFPPPVKIPEIKVASIARTSHIYAADGSRIASLHAEHNREPIKLSQMSTHLQNAVIAAEDSRFFDHRGLDLKSILRAARADIKAGSAVQGGSTITQQFVKNAFVGKERTFFRKVQEALVASQLEKRYSKKDILERYLNTVYFGRGAYGVEAAAKTYFGKPASRLNLNESALLAGLIPAPVRFSPYDHPVDARIRRKYVIDRMEELNMISPGSATAARANSPRLVDPTETEEIFRFPWFVDAVRRYLFDRYGSDKIFSGGYKVYTTIDPRLQQLAEEAVEEHLPLSTDPYASLVTIEPSTGYVKAIVGGRDYQKEKFNIALQARRQPGSSFKPLVLVAALESGISPDDTYRAPSKYCELKVYRSKDGCVHNFGEAGFGRLTVAKATVKSVNTVYIQLAERVGAPAMVEVAKRMGISERSVRRDGDNIAIALGGFTEGVTPFEMASAYSTLARRGIYREPKLVSKVVDFSGKILEKGPEKGKRALEEAVADNVTKILQGVITDGTAKRADIGRPAAGKTGTAQDFRNAWFVGYTPDLSTSVWVGYKERNRELLNIKGFEQVTGGSIPAQIWASFMKPALEGSEPSGFAEATSLGGLELPYRPSPAPSYSPEATTDASPLPEYIESPTPSPSPSPTKPPKLLPFL
ncbi:MAG: transglycosylase domain-containing protein [Actinomycetota bacterium]